MSKEGDALAAGVVGLGIGLLVGAAIVSNSSDRHAQFVGTLNTALMRRGIILRSANLGRDVTRPIWALTLRLPNQHIVSVHAPIDPPGDPLNTAFCEGMADQVMIWLRGQGLVPA